MDRVDSVDHLRPKGVSSVEWHLRLELAACYRLFDFMGWTELIFNHITLRVPRPVNDDGKPCFLINPYGLHYSEVTARNLVKVDIDGKQPDGGDRPVNPAGMVIHTAVHAARDDAHCVMHTHTTAGMAVACKQHGLRTDNFYSAQLAGQVAYHDFEGITTNPAECDRLVTSLGSRPVMILRNHGLLAIGPDVPDAFLRLWTLQRACEVQMAADSAQGESIPIGSAVLAGIAEQQAAMSVGESVGRLAFDGVRRRAGIQYKDIV